MRPHSLPFRQVATSLLAATLLLSASPAAFAAVTTPVASASTEAIPQGKLSDAAKPVAYRLDLTVIPDQERFSGHSEIDVVLKAGARSLYMHGRDLNVTKAVAIAGGQTVAVTYTQVDPLGVARIDFASPLPAGPVTLKFDYDAPFGDGPEGLYRIKVGDDWYAWTQFESIDARAAFPSFDEPGFKTPFSVTLTTTKGFVAASNAPETGQAPVGDLVKHSFADTKPLPTYLVAFVVGPFVTAEGVAPPTPQRSYPLPIRIIATKPNADKLDYALQETPSIVAHLESYFGQPFPFPKLDQIGSPVMPGAMENAGADIYGDDILLLDKGASTRQKQAFGMVVAHELSHQWFGDLVTPAWWDDIWLNESFANWMGYRIGNEWRPELNIGVGAVDEGFAAMGTDALKVGRPIHQPILKNGDIDAAFDGITYGKGGQVVAMIAAYLGDDKFKAGVRLHMSRHAYGNANSEEFFGALADAAKDPLVLKSLKSFVDQQGVPVVSFTHQGDKLIATQSRYARLGTELTPQTWTIPLCIRRSETRTCTLLDSTSLAVAAPGKGAFMPNAGGTGYYRFNLTEADWKALIATGATLPAGEGLATIDSLWAQYYAGKGSASDLIEAARVMVNNPDSNVAVEGGDRLAGLYSRGLITEDTAADYRRVMETIYLPRLKALGFDPKAGVYLNDDPDRQKLRTSLVNLVADDARDPGIRQQLSAAAAAYLGGDASALDQSVTGLALSVYAEEGGLPTVQSLFEKALGSKDQSLRSRGLRAITSGAKPETATWIMTQLGDKRLRSSEKLGLVAGLLSEPATRDMTYDWFKANYESLSSGAGIFNAGRIASLPGAYCSAEKADEIDSIMRAKVIAAGRGELSFNRMLEGMRNCSALKAAKSGEVNAAFKAAK